MRKVGRQIKEHTCDMVTCCEGHFNLDVEMIANVLRVDIEKRQGFPSKTVKQLFLKHMTFHSPTQTTQLLLAKPKQADPDPTFILKISISLHTDCSTQLLLLVNMSRRPTRRFADAGSIPFVGSLHPKSRPSPLLSLGLVVGALLIIGYVYHSSGGRSAADAFSRLEGGTSCTAELHRALPVLKKAYGDNMRKVLHIGPDTCSVVSSLLKEEDTEAWGIEPYDLDETDSNCKALVHKGIVRVADIKFPLPYRSKSFSLVIVSDAVDYLSPRYLNRTLPELARVAADGLVILSGYPGQQKVKGAELSKFGRPAKLRSSSWWIRFFIQTSLEENEPVTKKFEQAAAKRSYKPACQVFHLKPLL